MAPLIYLILRSGIHIVTLGKYILCTLFIAATSISTSIAVPESKEAAKVFAEAETICERDDGEFWGVSICGPILLVDYRDRTVIANEADESGYLTRDGDYYRGVLSEDVVIANTPTEWAGKRWTQLVSPVTEHDQKRPVLIAHELFHRIQPRLGLSRQEARNAHLDTLDGRYLLQLEWRALTAALETTDDQARVPAIKDALAFRRERYRLFPDAAHDERMLEINEGIPEFSGVMLGLTTSHARIDYAIGNLAAFTESPTFVRSFAYATGPAYGLLLNDTDPEWVRKVNSGKRFDQALASAFGITEFNPVSITERATRYGGERIRHNEEAREKKKRKQLAAYKAELVDGPVLILPLFDSSFQFNPQTLTPLEGHGTVFPTFGLKDKWGSLQVEDGGALLHTDKRRVTVSAGNKSVHESGADGWTLTLKPGWSVTPADRKGDLTLECKACSDTCNEDKSHEGNC